MDRLNYILADSLKGILFPTSNKNYYQSFRTVTRLDAGEYYKGYVHNIQVNMTRAKQHRKPKKIVPHCLL